MTNDFETLISGQQFKKIYEKKSNRITEEYGLNKIEIEILAFLGSTHYDQAKDIAQLRFFSKAHVSKAIDNLIRSGYLLGTFDEDDRRRVHLELTEESQPVLAEIRKLQNNLTQTLFSGVTEEEKQTMLSVAKKIVHNINNELH